MKKNALLFAVGHFLVDFACALMMLGNVRGAEYFLLYNFCAFALQMPIGLIADMVNHCKSFSVFGILLVLTANLPLPIPVRVLLAGLGNACYHVGGGRSALLADKKRTGLGIFVAPGAMGIFLGGVLAGNGIAVLLCAAGLTACGAALCLTGRPKYAVSAGKPRFGWLLLMFLVVVLRSAVGMCMETPWKAGVFVAASAVCTALGKAAGGFAGDLAPWKRTGICSLLVSAALYCLPDFGIAGCAAVLLFNMTMPITLRAAADDLPGMEGFAFGTLTFALFLGYLAAYYRIAISPWWGAALAAVSAGLLALHPEKRT